MRVSVIVSAKFGAFIASLISFVGFIASEFALKVRICGMVVFILLLWGLFISYLVQYMLLVCGRVRYRGWYDVW